MARSKFLAVVALGSMIASAAFADEPGAHPAYIHAMGDLRTAVWNIDSRAPNDGAMSREEGEAREQVIAAINDLQEASHQDHKPFAPLPPDARGVPSGHLHAAVDLLVSARRDVDRREDDPRARDEQGRALGHIDTAIALVNAAIQHAERR